MNIVCLDPVQLQLKHWLHKRAADISKWDLGHLLLLGGDLGMAGAVRLAGESALRTGSGMVTVLMRPQHINAIVAGCPELMVHGVADSKEWEILLSRLLPRITVLLLGSGLGHEEWGRGAFQAAMNHASHLPWVVDADGLNLLAETMFQSENWILTPHVREAARLLGVPLPEVDQDRPAAAQALQEKYGGVVVLKGAKTLIVVPGGETFSSSAGNPGMATAGMGDILSGIIAGLLAQKLPLAEAAKIGVYLHALAGNRAATAGERGTKAGDLMQHIREVVNWDHMEH